MIGRLCYICIIRYRKQDRERSILRCEVLNLFVISFIYAVIYYAGDIKLIGIMTQLLVLFSITIIFLEIWALTDDSYTLGLLSLLNSKKLHIEHIPKIDKIFSEDKLNERRLTNIKLGIFEVKPGKEMTLTDKGKKIRKTLIKVSSILGMKIYHA